MDMDQDKTLLPETILYTTCQNVQNLNIMFGNLCLKIDLQKNNKIIFDIYRMKK